MAEIKNDDSVDIIFEVLQKEYEAEESRNKHLETKAQIMLALCGIIVSANMFLLKTVIESSYWILVKMILLFIVSALITYAIYELLQVLKTRAFDKTNHNALTCKNTFKLTSVEIKSKLIFDYNKCINSSFKILNSKVESIKYGANLIEVAVVILCFVLFLALVSTYFEKDNIMTKNNTNADNTKTTRTPQTSQTPVKPSQNGRTGTLSESSNDKKGDGFGTVTVERGHKK